MSAAPAADRAPQLRSAELAERVEALTISLDRLRATLAHSLGVNTSEFAALSHLSHVEHLTPKEIAELLGVATSSVTYVVDRLEAAGLLARKPHPDDRRSLLVELTDQGVTVITEAYGHYYAAIEAALTGAGVRQTAEVISFMSEATERLDAASAALVEHEQDTGS